MITAEDNMVCEESDRGKFGFSALYHTCRDNEIAEGVILCASIGGRNLYMFQLDTLLSPLYDDRVNVMPGTLKACVGSVVDVNHFDTAECRFPTEEELKWYESTDTV